MTELAELWVQIGSAGFLAVLFGYLLLNLVNSQKEQTEDLESIRADLSKMSAELSNTQSISIKLIDSVKKCGAINTMPDTRVSCTNPV